MAETLERTKKRYQSKLKRLEQQILQPMIQKQLGLDVGEQSVFSSSLTTSGVSIETDDLSTSE